MPAQTIRGIIFDMDGVIARTDELHYQSWVRLAQEERVPFTRADYDAMRGLVREDCLRRFVALAPYDAASQAQAWMERKNAYFLEAMAHLSPADALPGVVPLIDASLAAGLRVGVGSSSRNAKSVLAKLGLLHRFHAVGDGYTVTRPKPSPDIFLWVAGGLGLKPTEILVLEDAQAGIDAARVGGFHIIGVRDAQMQGADAVIPSLQGVTLTDLLALLDAPITQSLA